MKDFVTLNTFGLNSLKFLKLSEIIILWSTKDIPWFGGLCSIDVIERAILFTPGKQYLF